MRAVHRFRALDRDLELHMTISALEEIADVNPALAEIYIGAQTTVWELAEIQAVIRAGLRAAGHGEAGDLCGQIIEEIGLAASADLVKEAMAAAFRDDSGKYTAVEIAEIETSSPSVTS